MAGSLVYREYESDSGLKYGIRTDESNAESVVGGQVLSLPRTTNTGNVPQGLRPRYVLAFNQDNPAQKKRFIVGNPSAIGPIFAIGSTIITNPSTTDGDGVEGTKTFVVTAYRGERINFIPAAGGNVSDTGLDDGDPT